MDCNCFLVEEFPIEQRVDKEAPKSSPFRPAKRCRRCGMADGLDFYINVQGLTNHCSNCGEYWS